MHHPRDAQLQVFNRLKKILRGSELSIRSGFELCSTLEEFRHIPSSTCESLHPYLRRAFERGASESRIFGRTDITGFARTSGSLGEPKDIPMNKDYLKSLDRTLVRMVASHLYNTGEWETMFKGRRVLLGSRPLVGSSPTGLPISDISGLIPTRTWKTLRRLFIPKYDDLWIQEWSKKVELILEQAHGKNVVSISGIPALALDFAKRAQMKYGVANLNELWPNFCQYYYGGVHLSAEQKQEMQRSWFDPAKKSSFVEAYFATEAPLAFSYHPHEEGLALNSLENLYLFRRCTEEPANSSLMLAHELEANQSYFIYVTTPGGLINYQMGDRIEVLTTNPLRILVSGREKEEISMTGEKITVAQLDLSLSAVGFDLKKFSPHLPIVWIDYGDKPHLVWGIPHLANSPLVKELGNRLDQALSGLNILYAEALLQENVIGESRIVPIPITVFEKYEKSRLGVAQFKQRRVFNSVAELIAVLDWIPSEQKVVD